MGMWAWRPRYISLGRTLAVLGADILKLLQGELHPNRPDVGKIDKIRFYVCLSVEIF